MFILRAIYHFLLDAVQTLLLAASIFLVIYVFFYRPFQVSGSSMYPTFHDGEYVITDLISMRFKDLQKGDVVVFHAPPPSEEKDYIKRVIALPEDSITLRAGSVYVNNKLLDESAYLNSTVRTYGEQFLHDGETVVVPPNSYFVMGDNRGNSSDSREFKFISLDKIIGKSLFVYWPPTKMRLVKNPYSL